MEKYKLLSANYGIESTVNNAIADGYIPIGRGFTMNRVEYQSVVHSSVLEAVAGPSDIPANEKYKVAKSGNEQKLVQEVNAMIEQGYLPVGRLYWDNKELWYKQTLIHRSVVAKIPKEKLPLVMETRTSGNARLK